MTPEEINQNLTTYRVAQPLGELGLTVEPHEFPEGYGFLWRQKAFGCNLVIPMHQVASIADVSLTVINDWEDAALADENYTTAAERLFYELEQEANH